MRKGLSEGLYDITEVLGSGAYAWVVVARDRAQPDRQVALKVLRKEFLTDATVLARFLDEAEILMRFAHPNIVDAYRILDYGGQPVLELELVQGAALSDLLHGSPKGLPTDIALHVAREVAAALIYGWEAQVGPGGTPLRIIHRDVKPNNILLSEQGAVKVVDFGIAKGDFDDRKAKSLYLVQGTAEFDAPDRRRGDDTPAADVYSLGVMLFVLLTGRSIVLSREQGRHDTGADRQLEHLAPTDLRDPKAVRNLVRRMIRYHPQERPSMAEVVKSLERIIRIEALRPDLSAFAESHIRPLMARRQRGRGVDDEVRFLETHRPTPPRDKLSPGQLTAEVRRFLRKSDWHSDVPELLRLITRCPTFVEAPFLALLDRATVPKWKFWMRPASPAEIEAILMILCDHPSESVVNRARELAEHDEARVAAAARFVLNTHGG